ncbi:MAG: MopE-related protein [Candidatus Thiodiazotropha sp.]
MPIPDPVPAPDPQYCTDADSDGFFAEGESCGTEADFNDSDHSAYPGAPEDCTDGVDNDGNGLTDTADPNSVNCSAECTDMDSDGYSTEGGSCGAIDCDDNNSAVNPGAAEICGDHVDNNCNGLTDTADMNAINCPVDCTDADGDGYSIEGGNCGAIDCDDTNFDINPGALEICGDAIDNNCNALADYTDSVCQNDNSDDGSHEEPWWRSHHWNDHDCNCDNHENSDSDEGIPELNGSEENEFSHNDHRYHGSHNHGRRDSCNHERRDSNDNYANYWESRFSGHSRNNSDD